MVYALPTAVLALAWSDVMLAALAYRHDVGATVRARAVVEPWTISIAALGLYFVSPRDGLLFGGGMVGFLYELTVTTTERPTILVLCGAMMGLPAFLRSDERRNGNGKGTK